MSYFCFEIMNRWLLIVCIVFLLSLAALYLFIPSTIEVSKVVPVKCNVEAAARVLADTNHWNAWWPGAGGPGRSQDGHPVLAYGKGEYAVTQRLLRSAAIGINAEGLRSPSMLVAIPHRGIDSCFLQWSFQLRVGWNPIGRLKDYWGARRVHADMGDILSGLRHYLETDSLLYGFTITPSRVYDTLVAETSRRLTAYPATADIYSVAQELEDFVKGYGGRVVGQPIMNVTQDSGRYLLRVAVPVDRQGPQRDGVVFHIMPKMALYLQADAHGGEWSVRQGLQQMENYISDHQKIRMAIPFLTLITYRPAEPDTSKWVTRIDYPFF